MGLRKREKLQAKDPQVQSATPPVDNEGSRTEVTGQPDFSEESSSISGSPLAYQEETFAHGFNIDAFNAIDQEVPQYSSPDFQSTTGSSFDIATTLEDALLVPFSPQTTALAFQATPGNDTASAVVPVAQHALNSSPSNVSSATDPTTDEGGLRSSSFAYARPTPTSAFANYALTDPSLSVLCAKVDIFNAIVGPGFSLDIWDPTALSPIFLGAVTKPCPVNFQPTRLQRTVPHHSVIDVFPWPTFRDRFLYIMSLPKELRPKIAQDDTAMVVVELMMAAKDAAGGIRVWGSNAFSTDNWEIGQSFYSKFWWAMDATVVRSSNQRRARRGDRPLRLEFLHAS